MSKSICLGFQVHLPYRLRTYRFFEIGNKHNYFDEYSNRIFTRRVVEKCYLPMNSMIADLIGKYGSKFKVSFSFSGDAIELMEQYAPEAIESFAALVKTGNVEVLATTYSHSLASLWSETELKRQVTKHKQKIKELFNVTPKTFHNAELIYNDEIGATIAKLGYNLVITEGAKHILGWKSPNYLYANAINPKQKVMLRNSQLSDDVVFRFNNPTFTAEEYAERIANTSPDEEVINLFMEYDTFGEYYGADSGIFDFFKSLPAAVFDKGDIVFDTPSVAVKKMQPVSVINVPDTLSWSDEERDINLWLGNDLQEDAFQALTKLAAKVKRVKDEDIKHDWEVLQIADYLYYMNTKWLSNSALHRNVNQYPSPYDAYVNYMNIVTDFSERINNSLKNK